MFECLSFSFFVFFLFSYITFSFFLSSWFIAPYTATLKLIFSLLLTFWVRSPFLINNIYCTLFSPSSFFLSYTQFIFEWMNPTYTFPIPERTKSYHCYYLKKERKFCHQLLLWWLLLLHGGFVTAYSIHFPRRQDVSVWGVVTREPWNIQRASSTPRKSTMCITVWIPRGNL